MHLDGKVSASVDVASKVPQTSVLGRDVPDSDLAG